MKSTKTRIAFAAMLCGMVIAALLLAFPTTTNAAPKPNPAAQSVNAMGNFCTTTVRKGEALYQIAARFRTTTAYLASINNLFNPNYIYTGMVLNVPCAPQPQPQPQPQPNPNPQICSFYIVQRGDWLKTIAQNFGVSWQLLAQVNGLTNANYIYAGQRLAIPCSQQPQPPVCPGCWPCQGCPPPVAPTQPPPVCPGCYPCQGCPPPVYPTQPPPVCPGCWPCQGCPPPTLTPISSVVEIHDNFFAPPVITVHQWQWVQWVNKSNNVHTVTQGLCPGGQCTPTPGGFNSGPLGPGGTYAFQFTQQGTFAYFDAASGVGATVAVVP